MTVHAGTITQSEARARLGVALLLCVVAGLCLICSVLAPAPAFAGKTVDSFFPRTTGSGTLGGQFSTPRGVAVRESTGQIYVADDNNHRIQRFSSDGTFQRAWGRNVSASATTGNDSAALGYAYEICTTASDCQGGTSTAAVGGFTGNLGGMFDNPQGIAIDQSTGHVFVRDRDNRRIQEFDADGGFIRAWGADVELPAGGAAFEVCAVAANCKAGATTGATGAGAFASSSTNATGIAVSPATGDVFAVDPANRRVQQFDPGAATPAEIFVRAWGTGVDSGAAVFEVCTTASTCQAGAAQHAVFGDPPPAGRFGNNYPRELAIDSAGVAYATNHGAGGGDFNDQRVERFRTVSPPSAGDASATLASPFAAAPAFNSRPIAGLAIDPDADAAGPDADRLYVALPSSIGIQEWGVSAEPPVQTDTHMVGSGLTPNGLTVDPALDTLYVSSTSSSAHRVYILDDDGADGEPDVTLLPPTGTTATATTLRAEINPQGFPTAYRFQYSKNGVDWTDVTADQSVGTGIDDVSVDDAVDGLQPNTLYRVRMLVTRGFGNGTVPTAELTFATDAVRPELSTVRADAVTDTSVRLSASINPHSSPTTYRFEYGVGAFTHAVPVPSASIGAGPDFEFVAERVSGLAPATTYQMRVVAESPQGVTTSETKTFTTRSAERAADARAYELVSPADKVGGVGVGSWYDGVGALGGLVGAAAHRGERFVSRGNYGSMLTDGGMAWAHDLALGERTPAGWVNRPAMTRPAYGTPAYRMLNPLAASPDLGRFAIQSNGGVLRMFPELASWTAGDPSFVSDWAGNWEIVGPTAEAQIAAVQSFDTATYWTLQPTISADGSRLIGVGPVRGMLGPDDPTHDLVAGLSLYIQDISSGPSNEFPALENPAGRSVVHVCTGDLGSDRTQIPAAAAAGGHLTGVECPAGADGRDRLISDRGASPGVDNGMYVRNPSVMSDDGSRVFFMSPDPAGAGTPQAGCAGSGASSSCPPQLYVRQERPNGSVMTRWISRAEDGLFGLQDASLAGAAIFEDATPDGSRVFFRTNAPLTADDPNGGCGAPCTTGTPSDSSWDLYMYELPQDPNADPSDGELTRVSRGPTATADANNVQQSSLGGQSQLLRFASDGGDRVYFATSAALPGVPGAANGTITSPGGTATGTDTVNLYSYENRGGESWRFVARLPRSTTPTLAECASTGSAYTDALAPESDLVTLGNDANCVRGTADGEFVTFLTSGRLTADDPDADTGDVYGYDAATEELSRLSRPQGGDAVPYLCVSGRESASLAPHARCYGDGGLTGRNFLATLNVATHPDSPGERIAFFHSRSRLVPEDTDGGYDVYEWRDGELALLTSGKSGTDGSMYVGNDRSGRNVYFATRDQYSWQDHDAVGDIYTARVGGGIPRPADPVVCGVLTGICQGSGADPLPTKIDPGVSGDGNVTAGPRPTLSVAKVTARARRDAARHGVLVLRVRTSKAGRVGALARGRIGNRQRVGGRGSVDARPGRLTALRVRMTGPARRTLSAKRGLRLRIEVTQTGVRPRTATVLLRRPGR